MTAGSGCPIVVAPLCEVASSVGNGLAGDVLSAIVSWIVQGASWLLDQLGGVMSSTTSVDLGASWFAQHYAVMGSLAGVVAVPMLLLSAIQAIYRQSPGVLARAAFVHLPLAGLLTAVAVQLVQLSLTVTNALCTAVSQGAGGDIAKTLTGVATMLVTTGPGLPGFVVGLGALLVVVGALTLWLELIVRSAAVYVAVLFLPMAMASLIWPAVSHWCRRLVETLVAVVLSKFVVVAVLSLAVGAIGTGTGFATLLSAAALLLLASFTPFTLLRLVPMIESGAALQLEGARQRVRNAAGSLPRTAASYALRQGKEAGLKMDEPGTGKELGPMGSGGGGGPGGPGGLGAMVRAGGPGGSGGPGGTDASGEGGAAMNETTDRPGRPWPLGPLPPEAIPPTLRAPDTTIPILPGTPEGTAELLSAIHTEPPPMIPDSVGGLPGIRSPLYGPTQPPSRFEPGPKDDWWTSKELIERINSAGTFIRYPGAYERAMMPGEPPDTLDGDVW